MDSSRSDPGAGRQHFTGVCLLSEDGGNSWQRSGEIVSDTDRGVMESQIVETSPDRLFCLFRTKGGYLYQISSEDGGATEHPGAIAAAVSRVQATDDQAE